MRIQRTEELPLYTGISFCRLINFTTSSCFSCFIILSLGSSYVLGLLSFLSSSASKNCLLHKEDILVFRKKNYPFCKNVASFMQTSMGRKVARVINFYPTLRPNDRGRLYASLLVWNCPESGGRRKSDA